MADDKKNIGPEAAEVVSRIYRMALDGYGYAETAAALEADGVFNPTYYWRRKGPTGVAPKVPWSLVSGAIPQSRKSSLCRNTAVMLSTSKATPSPTK